MRGIWLRSGVENERYIMSTPADREGRVSREKAVSFNIEGSSSNFLGGRVWI